MCMSSTNGAYPKTVFRLFHQWSKWVQYVEEGTTVATWGKGAGQTHPYTENRQRRTCNRCDKMQDERL